jgi:energy-coupling factor transporter ATP-binding protein EcfA2
MIPNIHTYNRILIIGHPASGKSTLCDAIAKVDPLKRPIWHTDHFMAHGWEGSLYAMIAAVNLEAPYIIEGVQGYRLLRKMIEFDLELPDVIVSVTASDHDIKKRYKERGKPVPTGTNKALDKIWYEFLRLCPNMPPVIHHNTSIKH